MLMYKGYILDIMDNDNSTTRAHDRRKANIFLQTPKSAIISELKEPPPLMRNGGNGTSDGNDQGTALQQLAPIVSPETNGRATDKVCSRPTQEQTLTPPPLIRRLVQHENNDERIPQILAFPSMNEEKQECQIKEMLKRKEQEKGDNDSIFPLPRMKLKPRTSGKNW